MLGSKANLCVIMANSQILMVQITHTHLNVSENVIEYLVLRDTEGGVLIIGVGTRMDDTIHV